MSQKLQKTVVRLPPEDRKSNILIVAKEVFSELGYEKFMPSTVADRCGVSEGTIYRYFPTKQDLLVTVAEIWLTELIADSELIDRECDIYSRLLQVIVLGFNIIKAEPALTRFIFMHVRTDPDSDGSKLHKLIARFTVSVTSVIQDGIKRGIFKEDAPVKVTRDMIFGAIEHQTWSYLRTGEVFPSDVAAEHIATMIFNGLAKPVVLNKELFDRAVTQVEQLHQATLNELKMIQENIHSASHKNFDN